MKKKTTLIEILGAITIIAILLTFGINKLSSTVQRAQLTHSQNDINSITVALYLYKQDANDYPYLSEDRPTSDQVYTFQEIKDFLKGDNKRGINYLNKDLLSRFITDNEVTSYENGNYMVALDFDHDEEIDAQVLAAYSSKKSDIDLPASIRVWMKHPDDGEDLVSSIITDTGDGAATLASNNNPSDPEIPLDPTPTANEPETPTPTVPETEDTPIEFDIEDEGTIVLKSSATMNFTVLGAAISYGGRYDMPVTVSLDIDGSSTDPYGSSSHALNGNINGTNPSPYNAGTLEEGTEISISASSWYKKSGDGSSSSDWSEYMSKSSDGSDNIVILRDGDPVPDTPGFLGQDGIADMVDGYVDGDKISLGENEAIVLFELGTNNMSSSAADFQDAVILVSFSK